LIFYGLPRCIKSTYEGAGGLKTMERVLVVEDSRPLQKALSRLFDADSVEVVIASDGLAGIEQFRLQVPDAVVLDLKLPGKPGKELCREFKSIAPNVPIIVLSANADIEDKVLLLELGADDYVTKPFSPKELLARVRRAMRRSQDVRKTAHTGIASDSAGHEILEFDDVRVDFTTMEACKEGNLIAMTNTEFKLLQYLARTPGRVISREELLDQVWGLNNYPTTRTVDNHILRLRQKLECDSSNPRHFLTVHGAGYKFVPLAVAGVTAQ
jgi:DNA-binding response OmpR family regulator